MKENKASFFERNSLAIKLFIIGFLAIILLVPISMIRSVVMERMQRQKEAIAEISSKWGHSQRIVGPVLTIPYKTYTYNDNQEKINIEKNEMILLPDDLKIDTEIIPEVRYRGLFRVVVYSSKIHLNGNFKTPQINISHQNTEVEWSDAFLSVGISDLRGIRESVNFIWNGEERVSKPGGSKGLLGSVITISNLFDKTSTENHNSFAIELNLNGSQDISFAPVGKETTARITSSWKSPSFDGAFLPANRVVSDHGFEAEWKVLELNRNYPQQWSGREVDLNESLFGVSLIIPVDMYQSTERSIKYAVLFISLTFLVFFFIEILNQIRVHPIHYVLVGFGLSLFYLLLLSLSEHIGFGIAYLIASSAIVILISGYSIAIFKRNKLSASVITFMSIIYVFLYVLLQLEDFALLLGSIVLFIILAAVMYLASKIDWYSIPKNMKGSGTGNKLENNHHS
jgi:inner membrane protein